MKRNDVILQTITRTVAFIIFAFSIYIFFAGHNHPGGGFIGGLMTSSAILLMYLAYDAKTMRRILPVNFIRLAAFGLLVAVLTGAGSFLFGAPFLSHTFTYRDLPVFGEKTELATAILFDAGVYFTVVGITMTIILSIGEDSD